MKKLVAIMLTLLLCLSAVACGSAPAAKSETPAAPTEAPAVEPAATVEPAPADVPAADPANASDGDYNEWTILWYLCGSDLESGGGAATEDIFELMEAELPEGINFVIETGGASEWQNDFVDASLLQRYVYNSEGLQLVDEQPSANMGDAQTLADFLAFGAENFPANKTAVVFWNHGGGSVSGAAFDELYDNDSLTLDEMYAAFSSVFTPSAEAQPLEFVGFDTCLMATVDVAYTFSDIAHYLVASEELEPGNGWYYTGWAEALAADPYMDGATLGQYICDNFYKGCEMVGTEDSITLSVTDLSRVGALMDAYEAFGKDCLLSACYDTTFFSQLARAANAAENYGGNTREQGYTNMVDLGDLARKSADLTATSQDVLTALQDCVLYTVNGPYRAEASGLSCYYSYNGDYDDFEKYTNLGVGAAFKYFFEYELTGEINESGMEYLSAESVETVPEVTNLASFELEGAKLDVDADGVSFLNIGADAASVLATIGFQIYYIDEQSDVMMLLGADNDIVCDWENGVFQDNFRGVWGAIDGCLVYMELNFEGDDYNLYSVPVLLNGEEYNLQVAYSFATSEWSILGARQGIDDSGMGDKDLRLLKVGDEITTLWYVASATGDDDFQPQVSEVLTVTDTTAFGEAPLFDGVYRMMFVMSDAMGNTAYSDVVDFTCENGEITTTVYE